jgi:hypothetical protein
VSWRTAACQPPGVIQELRWPHGGHGDCASARAGYGVRRWARAPRPAGARVGGAIHCVAAPAEALSLRIRIASSAGGKKFGEPRSKREALAFTQIWDDRLAGHTDGHTDTEKKASPAKTYRVARALFTRAVNLRGFPPGVPTGVGKNIEVKRSARHGASSGAMLSKLIITSGVKRNGGSDHIGLI